MEALPVNRLCKYRSSLLLREHRFCSQTCSHHFQTSRNPTKARRSLAQRQNKRLASKAQATAATVAFQSVDESVWDETYADKFGPLHYGLATLQGPREDMEDYASIVTRGRCGFLYAAIFDGHGGRLAADYMSKNLYEILSHNIDDDTHNAECDVERRDPSGVCCPVTFSQALQECFEEADKKLLHWLKHDSDESEQERACGTTATVCLVRQDRVVVANVGDSRAVLCRNGTAVDLSTEHRLYGPKSAVSSEMHRVQEAGGWIDDGRVCDILAVSRAFGDCEFKGEGLPIMLQKGVDTKQWTQEFADGVDFKTDPVVCTPDVTEIQLKEDDEFVIVASDGLWDVLESSQAISLARQQFKNGKTAQQVADHMARLALRRHTADNVAVAIVDILGSTEKGWQAKKRKGASGMFGMF